MIKARLAPSKGVSAHAIKRIAKDLQLLGYPRVILKSDQEPAILSLKERVKDECGAEVTFEESPGCD